MADVLSGELAVYEAAKAELVADHQNEYVLICGDEIATFKTEDDAIAEGYRRFGLTPFLVKQILDIEAPLNLINTILAYDDAE